MEENKTSSSPRLGSGGIGSNAGGEDRKYAMLSAQSVTMMAEAQGHVDLDEGVSAVLAEDVTYRLREIIQNSCQYMKHSRRKRLTVQDVNRALKSADVQPVYGHGAPEGQPWRQTKEGELFLLEDLDMSLPNIACSSQVPHDNGSTTVRANWLVIEGNQKGATLSQSSQGKVNVKSGRISDDLLQYHNSITRAILGTDQELMKLALTDLRTNPNLSPLLPYLVEFVANWIKNMNHDPSRLTKLLYTINALVNNNNLFLEPRPYLNVLTECVIHCMTESLDNSECEHWSMRDYAARLLAIICRQWDSPINRLYDQVLRQLSDVLHDNTLPFSAHYGVITALCYFGVQALKDVLVPYFHTYWQHLTATLEDVTLLSEKMDAHKVYGALMCAAEVIIKYHQYETPSSRLPTTKLPQHISTASQATQPISVQPAIEKKLPIQTRIQQPISIKPTITVQSAVQDDISGVTLSLPDPPSIEEIDINNSYSQFVEYFGDSILARLPIRHFHTDTSLKKQKYISPLQGASGDPMISLGDADSHRSGEEMLQEFLKSTPMSSTTRTSIAMETTVVKRTESAESRRSLDVLSSDLSSYHSSSRSSGRSQSDDYFFNSEDNGGHHTEDLMTVKTTLTDPSKGIKLFISKRGQVGKHKLTTSSPSCSKQASRTASNNTLSNVFESVILQRPTYDMKFGFDTRNWKSGSNSPVSQPLKRPRKASLTMVTKSTVVKTPLKSKYRELCGQVSIIGKVRRKRGHKRSRDKNSSTNSIHSHSRHGCSSIGLII